MPDEHIIKLDIPEHEPLTIAEAWKLYRDKFYPTGMSPDQLEQVQVAFYCGCFTGISQIVGNTDSMDEEASMQYVKDRLSEATSHLREMAKRNKAKDN